MNLSKIRKLSLSHGASNHPPMQSKSSGRDILNNFDLGAVEKTIQMIETGSQVFPQSIDMMIEWNMHRSYTQMYAEVVAEKSALILESELQTSLGGKGHRPTPIQYFLYGIGASYLSTLMLMLSRKRIQVSQAKLRLKAEIDYSGLLTDSIIEEPIKSLHLSLAIKCDIDRSELMKIVDEAKSRCLVFNPVKVEISLEE